MNSVNLFCSQDEYRNAVTEASRKILNHTYADERSQISTDSWIPICQPDADSFPKFTEFTDAPNLS